jgi:hypothetical protein
MKFAVPLLLLIASCGAVLHPALVKAVVAVVKEEVVKKMTTRPTINLSWSETSNHEKAKDFVGDFVLEVSREVSFALRIVSFKSVVPTKRRPRHVSLFLIHNFKDFVQIYQKLTPENFKLNGFYPSYQILLLNGKIDEIEEIFKLMWRIQVYNVNVMFENENGEILVQTFHPFSDGSCGDTTVKTINRFKDGKFENPLETLFEDKMKNLHGCPIKVAIANDVPPHVIIEGEHVYGRDIDLINALASFINFTTNIAFVGSDGFFLDNGSSIGPLKALLDRQVDVSLSNWWLKENRLKFFDSTSSYISENSIFVVPHGSDFTALEKMIYPFDYQSWIAIISFLVIGNLVIFIIQRQSTSIQDFVFGREIRGNSLKLLSVFLGVSLRRLPGRNFARYLLMMFIIYSLIIRTLYQGSYYQLLKTQTRHGEIQSIDELMSRDLEIYVVLQNVDLFLGNQVLRDR